MPDETIVYIRRVRPDESACRPLWEFELVAQAAARGACFAAEDIPADSPWCYSHMGLRSEKGDTQ